MKTPRRLAGSSGALMSLVSALAITTAASGSSLARETDAGGVDAGPVETIIVTARRVQEDLQQVPLAVRVLGEDTIERNAVRDLEDVARLTAGLTYDIGGFPNDTRPALRGMQSERGRPSVAVMLDGIDLSGENLAIAGGTAGVQSSLFDIERIEVVKGPQSTLFGRNAFGGAINYISKRPAFEHAARLSLEVEEGDAQQATASLTGPLIEDLLAYRINLAVRSSDGRYTNPVNGGPLGGEDFLGGAASLRLAPAQGLDINARLQVTETEMTDMATAFLFSNTRLPTPGGSFTAGPPGTPPTPCPPSLDGLPPPVVTACTRGTYVGEISADVSDVQMGLNPLTGQPPEGMTVDQTIATIDARWETEIGDFRYQFGWVQDESYIEADGDFTDFPGPPGFVFSLSALQQLTYDNERVDHTLTWIHQIGDVELLFGGQILDEESTLLNDSKFWLRNPASPLAGPPFFLSTAPSENPFPAFYTRNTNYTALFGRIRWDVTERLRLGIEARQNEDEITYTLPGWRLQDTSLLGLEPVCLPGIAQGATFMGAPGPGAPPPGTVQACPREETVSFSELTPRFTADFMATEDVFVYASIARGYKPGGFNVNEVSELTGQGYLPEFVTAYEIGVKSAWLDNRLIVNADIYYNDYTDQQIGVQRNESGAGGTVVAVPGIANAAAVRTQGFELDADWRLDNGLRLSLAYAYTDAEFETYVQGPPTGSAAGAFEACGVPDGQTSSPQVRTEAQNACADFSGNAVPKSPEHALNLSAYYSDTIGASDNEWFVELLARYRSKRFVDEANLSWMPAYTIVDLYAGLQFERASITAFVRNLTDDDTIQMAQRQVDPGNPEGFAPGRGIVAYLPEPRTLGVRVAFDLN